MAVRRDSLRLRLMPARSIEETGLGPSLHGGFLSPRQNTPMLGKLKAESLLGVAGHSATTHVCSKCQYDETARLGSFSDVVHNGQNSEHQHFSQEERRSNQDKEAGPENSFSVVDNNGNACQEEDCCSCTTDNEGVSMQELGNGTILHVNHEDMYNDPSNSTEIDSENVVNSTRAKEFQVLPTSYKISEMFDRTPLLIKDHSTPSLHPRNSLSHGRLSSILLKNTVHEDTKNTPTLQFSDALSSFSESWEQSPKGMRPLQYSHVAEAGVSVSREEGLPSTARSKVDARSRWKRAAHSITFINHMAASIRSASTDLIEDRVVDEILQQQAAEDDAGGVGAAAFEGSKTVARTRSTGRRGMEGLLVRQNRGFITFFQDFYVAFLKMPIGLFLVGVFLAPLILGLIFTPFYLLDVDGLSFNGIVPEDATTSPLVSAKQRCLAFLNIFLYALSLSTTFGGAPVAARSPFCLLVANVNTLLAQFLFVFLSGAVFARMSQPSYPIRCSKTAIIKTDDLLPVLGLEQGEKYKAFAVRLVLTGPSPCELVDAKICLTFRIFVTLPSGSVFCSTHDLEVVRPEVSYLRYGLMVRHIIDKKSPVYGHTMESLRQGDASFSLTVVGMERTSMQPVFHLEDYFVCDNDVVWEGDYEDFIHVNAEGQRVLDHSRIDLLKPMKTAARVSQAVVRMKNLSNQRQGEVDVESRETESRKERRQPLTHLWRGNWPSLRKRTLFKSMSTSFTRADW